MIVTQINVAFIPCEGSDCYTTQQLDERDLWIEIDWTYQIFDSLKFKGNIFEKELMIVNKRMMNDKVYRADLLMNLNSLTLHDTQIFNFFAKETTKQ